MSISIIRRPETQPPLQFELKKLWCENSTSLPHDLWIEILKYLPAVSLVCHWARVCKAAWTLSWDLRIWEVFQKRFDFQGPLDRTTLPFLRQQALEFEVWSHPEMGKVEEIYLDNLSRNPLKEWSQYSLKGFEDPDTALFETKSGALMGIDLKKMEKKDYALEPPKTIKRSPDLFLRPIDLEQGLHVPFDKDGCIQDTRNNIQIPPADHHYPQIYNFSPRRHYLAVGYTCGLVRIIDTKTKTTLELTHWDWDQIVFLKFIAKHLLIGWKEEGRIQIKVYSLQARKIITTFDDVLTLFFRNENLYYIERTSDTQRGYLKLWCCRSYKEECVYSSKEISWLTLYDDYAILLNSEKKFIAYHFPSQGYKALGSISYFSFSETDYAVSGDYLLDGLRPLFYLPTFKPLPIKRDDLRQGHFLENGDYVVAYQSAVVLYQKGAAISFPSATLQLFGSLLFVVDCNRKSLARLQMNRSALRPSKMGSTAPTIVNPSTVTKTPSESIPATAERGTLMQSLYFKKIEPFIKNKLYKSYTVFQRYVIVKQFYGHAFFKLSSKSASVCISGGSSLPVGVEQQLSEGIA